MTEEVEQPTALTKGEAFGNVYTHLIMDACMGISIADVS